LPTYEYECKKCGHRFSEFQKITDQPVRNCPKCRRRNSVEQLISGGSGLIFKGSGFYVTDYKKPQPKPAAGDAGTGPSTPASGAGQKKPD